MSIKSQLQFIAAIVTLLSVSHAEQLHSIFGNDFIINPHYNNAQLMYYYPGMQVEKPVDYFMGITEQNPQNYNRLVYFGKNIMGRATGGGFSINQPKYEFDVTDSDTSRHISFTSGVWKKYTYSDRVYDAVALTWDINRTLNSTIRTEELESDKSDLYSFHATFLRHPRNRKNFFFLGRVSYLYLDIVRDRSTMESAFDGVYRNEINQRNTAATLLLKTGYHTSDFFQEFGIEIEFRNENDMTTNVARTIWSGDQEYRKISDYSLVYHHESPFFTNTILSAYYGLNIRSSLSMSNDYRYPELFKAHRYFKKEGSIHTNLEIPLLLNVSAGKHTDFFLFYKFYFNHYYTSNDTRTEQHLSSGSNRTRFGIKVKQHNYELVGSLENINVASAELRKYF